MSNNKSVQEMQLHRDIDAKIKENQPTDMQLMSQYAITVDMRRLHDARLDDETSKMLDKLGLTVWSVAHEGIIRRFLDILFNSDIGHEFVEKHRRPNEADAVFKDIEKVQKMLLPQSVSISTAQNPENLANFVANNKPDSPVDDGLSNNDRIVNDLHNLLTMCEKNQEEVLANRELINKQNKRIDKLFEIDRSQITINDELTERIKSIESSMLSANYLGSVLGSHDERLKAHEINFQNNKSEVFRMRERLYALEKRPEVSPANIQDTFNSVHTQINDLDKSTDIHYKALSKRIRALSHDMSVNFNTTQSREIENVLVIDGGLVNEGLEKLNDNILPDNRTMRENLDFEECIEKLNKNVKIRNDPSIKCLIHNITARVNELLA